MRSVIIVGKYLLFFLLVVVIINCSITEKRYKVLRVFLDGVPDPNQAKKESISPGEQSPGGEDIPKQTGREALNKSLHPDFAARQCDKCHNKSATNFLKKKKEEFCFICHDESDFKGNFIHGPVAVRDCQACHFPHRSKHEKLLKVDRAGICLMCHLQEDVAANDVHEDLDFEKGACTECHDPHVAESEFFLK